MDVPPGFAHLEDQVAHDDRAIRAGAQRELPLRRLDRVAAEHDFIDPQALEDLARVLCITAAWAMNRNERRLPRIASSRSTASMMNTPRENRSKRYRYVAARTDAMLPKMLTDATRAGRPQLAAEVRAMMARQSPGGVTAALRGMMERPDRTSWLPSIDVPTLIITSDGDALIPQTEGAALAQAIPRSKLVVIPGAAHLSNVENPNAFNNAVREFLATLPS